LLTAFLLFLLPCAAMWVKKLYIHFYLLTLTTKDLLKSGREIFKPSGMTLSHLSCHGSQISISPNDLLIPNACSCRFLPSRKKTEQIKYHVV
ncbi:MAG: hypothetical protein WCS03_18810, partial [Bacteroidota bacterium]